MDAKIIVTQLNSRISEVVSYLLPKGKKQGNEWVVGSLQGEPGESLKVCLHGPKIGVFADFATGEAGDSLELWKKTRGLDTRSAMEEASIWIGCDYKPAFYPKRTEPNFRETTRDWHDIQPIDPVFQYLTNERGLTENTLSKFNIGIKDNKITFPYQYHGKTIKDNEYENLKSFKRINVCFDQDGTGRESIKEVVTRLGAHRCFVVQLPCKDANEFLAKYSKTQNVRPIQYYFDNAIDCAPNEFCNASRYAKVVEEYFYPKENSFMGYMPPWEGLKTKLMFRHNELSIWTGINGHGKSQLLGQIGLDFMQQGAKVCFVSLEMTPKLLLSRLIRQATGQSKPDKGHIEQVFTWFRSQLWIYENRSSINQEKLIQIMEYARCCHGIDVFIIDSLMKCGLGEEDYNGQKLFVEALCNFKNLHDCQIHIVAHPRKGQNEKQSPGKMDVKGSGALSDLADNVFAVWRNKAKSHTSAYDCKLSCDKHRNGEWEGEFFLWFDKVSFLFSEKVNAPIHSYITQIPILTEAA